MSKSQIFNSIKRERFQQRAKAGNIKYKKFGSFETTEYDHEETLDQQNPIKAANERMLNAWFEIFGEIESYDLPIRRPKRSSTYARNHRSSVAEYLDIEKERLLARFEHGEMFDGLYKLANQDVKNQIARLEDPSSFQFNNPNLINRTIYHLLKTRINFYKTLYDFEECRKIKREMNFMIRFRDVCRKTCGLLCLRCNTLRLDRWQPIITGADGPGILCHRCGNEWGTEYLTLDDVNLFIQITGITRANRQSIPDNYL